MYIQVQKKRGQKVPKKAAKLYVYVAFLLIWFTNLNQPKYYLI